MTLRTYPFGWLTPHLLPALRANPERLDDYLALTRADWHYVGLIVALMGENRACPDHFAAVERDLLWRSRREMLADVAPGVPPSLIKLLPKLRGALWRPPSYERLADLSQSPDGLKALRSRPSVSRRFVRTLHKLPPMLRQEALLRQITEKGDVERLSFAVDVVCRVRTDLTRDEVIRSLAHLKGTKFKQWVGRHYQKAPFPAAPWDGTDDLTPVRDYRALKKLALEFDNCVRDYHLDVLEGRSYFYRFAPANRPLATVELQAFPRIGWIVGDIEGVENETVPNATRAGIQSAFSTAGIPSMPRDTRRWDFF